MNINKLETGMEIRNYKELCEILGVISYKGGNVKKKQISEFERFFNYEKKGHKYIIKKIYKCPLPPNNSVTKYIPLLEKLILHIIFENGTDNPLYVNKGKLYEMLRMINDRYSSMKYHKMQLSKKYDIDVDVIKDFYSTSDDLLERNVLQALKSLENQSLVKYNEVYSVCEIEVKNIHSEVNIYEDNDIHGDSYNKTNVNVISKAIRKHRQATKEETQTILALQRRRLEELECYDMKTVYNKGLQREFYEPIKKQLLDNLGIEYYYKSYEMIFNQNHITDAYIKSNSYLLDEENQILIGGLLNNNISNKLKVLADNRSSRALSLIERNRIQEVRISDSYTKDISLLISNLIHTK